MLKDKKILSYKYGKSYFSYLYDNIKYMLKKLINIKIVWTTSMWARGQIVIPKEVRKELWLKPWDNMVVLMRNNKYIWLVKNENIWDLMTYVTSEWVVLPS